jgi:uncharacterized membrane protein
MKILFIVLFVFLSLISCTKQPVYPEPLRIGTEMAVEMNELQGEIPKYFTYHYRGKNINFFVVKVGDRVISFFDACASCYAARRGYRFDNGYFFCRACNERYSTAEIEKGVGSCFPIRLDGYYAQGKYFIPVSALEAMADKF